MIRVSCIPLVLLLLVVGCSTDAAEREAENAEGPATASAGRGVLERVEAIEQALGTVEGFHQALSEADSAGALVRLHRDAIIYESGHAETVAEYRAGHLPADIRFAVATEREILSEQTIEMGEQVLYLAETRVRGRVGERDIDSRGVETMILTQGDSGWLIRHIHWSSR